MKRLLAATAMTLSLTGCAGLTYLWESYNTRKFDAVEYYLVVDIRTQAELAQAQCGQDSVRAMAGKIYQTSLGYKNYAESLADNANSAEMSSKLEEMVRGVRDRYESGSQVSTVYCRSKFQLISSTATDIQQALARKKQ